MEEAINELISDYERKIEILKVATANIKENPATQMKCRLQTKDSCYKTFLTELKRIKKDSEA